MHGVFFQAVCKDRIFPKLNWFAVVSEKKEVPYRAQILTFGLGLCFTLIGKVCCVLSVFFKF